MIRKIALKKRPPIKQLLELFETEKEYPVIGWRQIPAWDNSDQIHEICAEILGISKFKIKNCMLHIIADSISPHRDNMSTGVYILPLHFSKTVEFYDETRSVHFERGFAYKFNDWVMHGISNPNFSKIQLVTIDT